MNLCFLDFVEVDPVKEEIAALTARGLADEDVVPVVDGFVHPRPTESVAEVCFLVVLRLVVEGRADPDAVGVDLDLEGIYLAVDTAVGGIQAVAAAVDTPAEVGSLVVLGGIPVVEDYILAGGYIHPAVRTLVAVAVHRVDSTAIDRTAQTLHNQIQAVFRILILPKFLLFPTSLYFSR